jgi:hypothetical protein
VRVVTDNSNMSTVPACPGEQRELTNTSASM